MAGMEMVDWDEFKRCWAMTNLSAIPADENLKKGAKVFDPREEKDDATTSGKESEAQETSTEEEEVVNDSPTSISIDSSTSEPEGG